MSKFLNNVRKALEAKKIDELEALYLIYKYEGIEFYSEHVDLLKLTKLKYVKGSKVGSILTRQSINKGPKGTLAPFYLPEISEISSEIPAYLFKLLCNNDPKTKNLRLPGDMTDTV